MKRKTKKKKSGDLIGKKYIFMLVFCVVMLVFAGLRQILDIPSPAVVSPEMMDEYEEEIEDEMEEMPLETVRDSGKKYNRVRGVHSWTECFPDINDVQLVAARKNGIEPVKSRDELERLVERHELVNISHSPYYVLDRLTHSMPYLVPKAQHLLNTICYNFVDSLHSKGLQPHLPIITSVLRTTEDVSKLQRGNGNATTNSCHCYGTTVDITYNRFVPLLGYYDKNAQLLRWDMPMKQVLAEVLRDLREEGQCYVKYERKQACFHLTVR